MADAMMTFGGDASRLVAEYQKLQGAERDYQREIKATQRAVAQREKDMIAGLKAAAEESKRVETAGTIAFNKMAAGMAAAAAAGTGLLASLRDVAKTAGEVEQKLKAASDPVGQLGQLATSPADLKSLTDQMMRLRQRGVTGSIQEAAQFVFAARSNDLGDADQAAVAKLRRANVIGDSGKFIESLAGTTTAFGKDKTGDFGQLISKAIVGSGVARGSLDEFLASVSGAAGQAKLAGFSPEDTMAAIAVMSKVSGPAEASTQFSALSKAWSKNKDLRGRSLMEGLQDLKLSGADEGQLIEKFGRQEGLQAYQILNDPANNALFKKVRGDIYAGTNADLATARAQQNVDNPLIRAQIEAKAAEGEMEVANKQAGIDTMLAKARIARNRDGSLIGGIRGAVDEAFLTGQGPFGIPIPPLDPNTIGGAPFEGMIDYGASKRAQEAALMGTFPKAQAGAAVAAPGRPYVKGAIILPQVPPEDDPELVKPLAERAVIEIRKLNREKTLMEQFTKDDNVLSPSDKRRMDRDPDIKKLNTILERLDNTIRGVEAKRRLNAGSNMVTPPN